MTGSTLRGVTVRAATTADLEAINAIYNREVAEGFATWELEPWPIERRQEWLAARTEEEPVVVADLDGAVAGFAYLTKYRGRLGYRFTRENTVFVHPNHQRQGIGRLLLEALLERARGMGLHTVLAFIDEENLGSIELHRALGYEVVGHEHETGHKFDEWRSSVEMQVMLDRGN
jgi:L-amino acid N-acyltransferase